MRFIVIILVSVLGYSLADVLQVKCGDELCERPSNLAVTTLRYVPDKPYKLHINSLNSEVEIFGATDDLYYARYGRNYGFLPKNHIREKAKGNFIHSVQLNLDTLRINSQVKETNFLHEMLKSSSQPDQQISNQTNSSPDENKHNHDHSNNNHNHEEKKVEIVEERPTDYIPIGTEPKDTVKQENEVKTESTETVKQEKEVKTESTEPKKEEQPIQDDSDKLTAEKLQKSNEIKNEKQEIRQENNDSGIEDDEDDDETDDEEEDDDEDEEADLLDIQEQKNDTITENTEPIKIEENRVELNATTSKENEEKPIEKVDDIKIAKPEIVQAENVVDQDKNVFDESKTIEIGDTKTQEPELIDNNSAENKTQGVEQIEAPKEPEKIEEIPEKVEEKIEIPEFKQIPEIKEEKEVKPRDPAPVNEEINEEPITTQISITEQPIQEKYEPEIPLPIDETTTPSYQPITNLPELKHEEITEVPPSSQEKREDKNDQDLLLKRFSEKLGHRHPEGVGSVEQIHHSHQHSHDQHGHSHDQHGHSHDSHSHSHAAHSHDSHENHQQVLHSHEHVSQHSHSQENVEQHSHDQQTATLKEDLVKEEIVDQDKKPGFFSGLVKKIFGDEHPHSHDSSNDAQKLSSGNVDEGFCEKIDSEDCPKSVKNDVKREVKYDSANSNTVDEYIKMILIEALEMIDVIITLGLVALTVLIFIFGHYCISKASKEGSLIRKMNELEREIMSTGKENGNLKAEVEITKQQLKSIQDNSFGSNDMVIALKQDLELNEREKEELLDKISSLEKELEAAAEDGLELNRMVSELLNNQTGSDSIISSVEDLQRQLNEQQETIITMNEALALKSRENSELQIQLSEINSKFGGEYEKFQQQVDAVALERSNLQIELENLKRESDMQVNQIIEERNSEVTRLNSELTSYAGKYDESKKLLTSAESKVQALEECIETIRKTKGGDFKNLLDVADLKADLLAVTKEKSTIQEQLQSERDSRKLLEDRVKTVSDDLSNLKKEFSVAEKEKLDAQTRLDVLSNYFKEKETQLTSELSLKEARWMKQQGETTSTVEKVQALNAEIQTLKSQNDELKAEFEAQIISYKAKLTSVEGQSHTAWLAAKQSERKMEEARMEAAALRRRLTSIAENPGMTSAELLNGLPGPNDSMNTIPSPMRVESPNNISLPPFLPGAPPFMPGITSAELLNGPPFMPPPFMPLPPMGLPPLGRLMSPPPKRFTPTMRDDRDRYSPRHGRYSPDSRYDDYTPFETETDISPPRSPVPQRRGFSSPTDRNKKSKGGHNSEQPSRRK
ncbi:hypothetical protein ACKWTF_001776 [Chironomus riparius]